ncbi:peptide MFS transporter [Marinihelvus fidelis]|uniref:Peptide MFS transporter n=2 Tax=Marinihelvus fidelis TaxID=2613842 RepID=A0A5N0TB84_9GAMM|nr:peptide MFS transporter [Marinihelvus fidelis]
MWERFAFYGMRAILAVYVATTFFGHLGDQANAEASLVYGGYTALVYATGIAGGYVADRVLGYQRSILLGAIIMAAGLFVLTIEDLNWFLIGLALVVAGNGLFKPNISAMIGKLYAPGDVRRDSGFTIFYMGINLGAFIAPFITSAWIGTQYGLKWGFFAAGIGMILSTLWLEWAKGSLGSVGRPEPGKDSWTRFFVVGLAALGLAAVCYFLLSASTVLGFILVGIMAGLCVYFVVSGVRLGKVQLQRYIAMLLLFLANACFWALFEQAGSSLNFFAREFSTPMYGDSASWQAGGFGVFQSANPLYILLFAPVFAAIWPRLEKLGMNPSIPRKFALGLIQVALGFFVLVWAINNMQNPAGLVPWIFLAICYLLHTTGELCISPIGLSMVTKLADDKDVGLAMGGWFLSIAMAQYVAGIIAAIASGGGHGPAEGAAIAQYSDTYMQLFWLGLVFGIVYLVAAPLINKLMHGVK